MVRFTQQTHSKTGDEQSDRLRLVDGRTKQKTSLEKERQKDKRTVINTDIIKIIAELVYKDQLKQHYTGSLAKLTALFEQYDKLNKLNE